MGTGPRVRRDVDAFLRLPGAPDFTATYRSLRSHDEIRPEWCLVVERDGVPTGRVAVRVTATAPVGLLGDLPPFEAHLVGLWLRWGRARDAREDGAALLAALDADPTLPRPLQARLNTEVHDHLAERREALTAAGMCLVQEKHGYLWQDDGAPLGGPDRLRLRTLLDVGPEAYRQALERVVAGTLDRRDAWLRGLAGAANWAGLLMEELEPRDAPTWLLATLPSGDLVGLVAVSSFDEPGTASITHIGVVPEHRGHGYARDLLLAATAAARARGFTRVFSDVDVVNAPMTAVLERAGHRGDARPWHVWHYRGA